MTLEETVDLLTVATAFDRRTVGEGDVIAWHAAIGDLGLDDARAAAIAHYRDSTEWIMPGHVRQRVRAMRSERLAREITPAPPAELTDNAHAYQEALQRRIGQIADGKQVRHAIGGPLPGEPPAAWSEVRKSLPAARPRPAVSDIALTQAEESRAARAVQEAADEETGEPGQEANAS
jgi:hypothetical protein